MKKLSISNRALGTLVVLVLVALTLAGLYLVAKSYKAVHKTEVAPKAAVIVCPTPQVQYIVITATPTPSATPSATVKLKPTVRPTVVVTP